ncbi:hypothetical protein Q5752_007109 [Cryptotrichosporon argae]
MGDPTMADSVRAPTLEGRPAASTVAFANALLANYAAGSPYHSRRGLLAAINPRGDVRAIGNGHFTDEGLIEFTVDALHRGAADKADIDFILSGQSGGGKTEIFKKLLGHITHFAPGNHKHSSNEVRFQQLDTMRTAATFLELFANARTDANPNTQHAFNFQLLEACKGDKSAGAVEAVRTKLAFVFAPVEVESIIQLAKNIAQLGQAATDFIFQPDGKTEVECQIDALQALASMGVNMEYVRRKIQESPRVKIHAAAGQAELFRAIAMQLYSRLFTILSAEDPLHDASSITYGVDCHARESTLLVSQINAAGRNVQRGIGHDEQSMGNLRIAVDRARATNGHNKDEHHVAIDVARRCARIRHSWHATGQATSYDLAAIVNQNADVQIDLDKLDKQGRGTAIALLRLSEVKPMSHRGKGPLAIAAKSSQELIDTIGKNHRQEMQSVAPSPPGRWTHVNLICAFRASPTEPPRGLDPEYILSQLQMSTIPNIIKVYDSIWQDTMAVHDFVHRYNKLGRLAALGDTPKNVRDIMEAAGLSVSDYSLGADTVFMKDSARVMLEDCLGKFACLPRARAHG